jgi:hypothetical protein
MMPRLSAPSWRARLGVIMVAVLLELLPELPGLGFFARSSRMGMAARGMISAGVTEWSGCAAGAGVARARVAKRKVDAAANFILLQYKICGVWWGMWSYRW